MLYENNLFWNEIDFNWIFGSGFFIGKFEVIFWCSIFIIEVVLVIVGNLFIMFVFFWSRKFCKRCYYLMINFVILDMFVGVFVMLLFVVFFGMFFGVWGEMFWIFGDVILFFDMLIGFVFIVFFVMIVLEWFYVILWFFNYCVLKLCWYVLFIIIVWMVVGLVLFFYLVIIKFFNIFFFLIFVSIKVFMWVFVLVILLLFISVLYVIIWGKVRILYKSVM